MQRKFITYTVGRSKTLDDLKFVNTTTWFRGHGQIYLINHVKMCYYLQFADVQVQPFGSIVTGLGIKTSDIDCYIQLPPNYHQINAVKWAKKILQRHYPKFSQLIAITTAKVPIVKFLHEPTGFNCDVNFSSSNGVRNSKLVAFLLSLDSRAMPLAIIIKYWGKRFNLTGTNLMANYTLTLMVIFYLQGKSVLPSVEELQRDTECFWVDNWNTAFSDGCEYVSDNSESLYMLLGGFFDYYYNFDYAQDLISPYLGRPVKKEEIKHVNMLPPSYKLYQQNVLTKRCDVIRCDVSMCVQDPFQHSRNCSVAVFPRLFKKIHAYFGLASKTFHENSSDRFLQELFSASIPQLLGQPKQKAKLKKINKNRMNKNRWKPREYFIQMDRHKFGHQIHDKVMR